MREILFRGKRTDTGEFVEGYYTLYNDNRGMKSAIITGTDKMCFIPIEIVPETLGQYTGLKDKNGKKVFEGDIVTIILYDEIGTVVYTENRAMYEIVFDSWYLDFEYVRGDESVVIGNIHDNPELMKGE